MRTRPAAALALFGWILILPPLRFKGPLSDPNTTVEADIVAPLSQWKKLGTPFATLQECREYPAHFRKLLRENKDSTEQDKQNADKMAEYWFGKSQCIASDDPRLKDGAR
jgi:hypothetical protein